MSVEVFRYFGSFVRGELDKHSDCDLLVVLQNVADGDERRLLDRIPPALSIVASVSWYSPQKIYEMFRRGDLFAWHLHLESRKVALSSEKDLIDDLGKPAEYVQAFETYSTFAQLLMSAEEQLNHELCSTVYEAGLLYVSIRNIAMALSWYTPGGLSFSRYSPKILSNRMGVAFPLSDVEFQTLVECRLSTQRGISTPEPSRATLLRQWSLLKGWAHEVGSKLLGAEHIFETG
jgi:hypothetical protein